MWTRSIGRMKYLGDYLEDYATLNFKFSTHKSDGTPIVLAGSPAVSVYKANNTTQSTAGITLSVDFDSVTGLNNVLIDLSADAFYAVANDYQVVITTGTVNSVSVVGTVLAHFSIENRNNKVNVVQLSGDTTAADNAEAFFDGTGYAGTNNVIPAVTTTGTVTNEVSANITKIGSSAQSMTDLKDFADTGYDPSTHKVQGVVLTDTTTDVTTKTGYSLSVTPPTAAAIADAICDEALSGHSTPGTVGIAITDTLGYSTATRTALTDIRAAALDRIVGTLATGTHNPQSGDAYGRIGINGAGLSALGDVRIAFLDASILSRSSHSAADVWTSATRTLSSFGTLVADIATAIWGAVARTITGGTITTNSDKTGYTVSTVSDKTGYSLSGTDLADIKAVTAKVDTALVADGGVYQFTANALELAPGGGSGGDATAANQTIIINSLTAAKGATFDTSTDSLEAIRNRGDAAWTTGGGMSGSNTITINVKDGSAVNIVGAWIEVWDSAGTSFIDKKQSNSSGNAVYNGDDGTYTIKMYKSGYSFTNQTIIVSGNTTANYTGTAFIITPPTDPTLCRVYTKLSGINNVYPSSATGTATIKRLPYDTGTIFVSSTVNGVYAPATGVIYWDLIQGANVQIMVGLFGIDASITVPVENTQLLNDLI